MWAGREISLVITLPAGCHCHSHGHSPARDLISLMLDLLRLHRAAQQPGLHRLHRSDLRISQSSPLQMSRLWNEILGGISCPTLVLYAIRAPCMEANYPLCHKEPARASRGLWMPKLVLYGMRELAYLATL